jgi:hypothetical protein
VFNKPKTMNCRFDSSDSLRLAVGIGVVNGASSFSKEGHCPGGPEVYPNAMPPPGLLNATAVDARRSSPVTWSRASHGRTRTSR